MNQKVHYPEIGYTVVYDLTIRRAFAYRIIATDEAGNHGYQPDDSDFGAVFETDSAECDVDVCVKTDGCANWAVLKESGCMHTCERSGVENYAKVMLVMYDHLMSLVDKS